MNHFISSFITLILTISISGLLNATEEGTIGRWVEKEDHYSFLVCHNCSVLPGHQPDWQEYHLMKAENEDVALGDGDKIYIDKSTEKILRHYVGASTFQAYTLNNQALVVTGTSIQPWLPDERDSDRVFTLTDKFFVNEKTSGIRLLQKSSNLESQIYDWFYRIIVQYYPHNSPETYTKSIPINALNLNDQLFLFANHPNSDRQHDKYPRILTFIFLDAKNDVQIYFLKNVTNPDDPSYTFLKNLEDEPFKVWGVDPSQLDARGIPHRN